MLTQRRIGDAALVIIQSHGYRALTMAALARQLGVSTSALYNHVGSKREILILLQDRINQEIDCSGFLSEPWDRALERWAWSYREVYSRNIPLIAVIAVMPVADSPHTLRMYETVTAALSEAGWPREWIVDAIVSVESLVFGSAYDSVAPPHIFDPGALRDAAPNFAAAVQHRDEHATTPPALSPADRAFQLALDAMLHGLRARLSELTPAR